MDTKLKTPLKKWSVPWKVEIKKEIPFEKKYSKGISFFLHFLGYRSNLEGVLFTELKTTKTSKILQVLLLQI